MGLKTILTRIGRDVSGGTAIEYGLIVSLIVIACIGAFESVADENTGLWAVVTSRVTTVMSQPA
jgi:pilus assembly protein Flp/PilA